MSYINCPACKKEFQKQIDTCTNCNFPFNASEKEKASHIGQFILKKGITHDSDDYIEKSRNILFLLAGAIFISLLVQYKQFLLIDIILNCLIIATYLWSALTINKKPFLKTSVSLVVYLSIVVLNFLIDERTLLEGVIFKCFTVGVLSYSLYLIKSSNKFKSNYLK